MQKRHTASVMIFLLGLFFLGLMPARALHGERTTKDPIFWDNYYVVLQGTAAEMFRFKRDYDIKDSEVRFVGRQGPLNIYRLPARYRGIAQQSPIQEVPGPPFRYLDPDIQYRRSQDDLLQIMRGYKDYAAVRKLLYGLQEAYPDYARVDVIGTSVNERPILALKISDNPRQDEDEPAFLFNCAHHGNEVLSVEYCTDLAWYLLYGQGPYQEGEGSFLSSLSDLFHKSQNKSGTTHYRSAQLQSWLDNYEIWIVPIVNPDGLHHLWRSNAWVGRKNSRDTIEPGSWQPGDGVDLNRNYPFYWNSDVPNASSDSPGHHWYRGPQAASEPETQAMMRLANRNRFVISFSYHTYATKILTPYTIPGSRSPFPNPAWGLAEKLIPTMRSHRTERQYITQRNLYAVDGTDQDWHFFKHGTLAFIMEGSHHNPRYEPEARLSIQGMRPAALKALELYAQGPVIIVHTQDQVGNPLGNVGLRLAQTTYRENERYTSHPQSGRYDFFLDEPGEYTVVASKNGYQTMQKTIRCQEGHCRLQIRLTPDS